MCIIAIKPAGVPMPDTATIRNMWQENPDGAGIMFPLNGQVHIAKGFMRLKNLTRYLRALEHYIDVEQTTVVLHFRIQTAGGKCPENTHPFPVSDSLASLRSLRADCAVGVVHNGIIGIETRCDDISDTMEYILSRLSYIQNVDPAFYTNKVAMEIITEDVVSKLAFLTPDGKTYTIGHFTEEKGVLYSNYSFKPWVPKLNTGYWSSPLMKSKQQVTINDLAALVWLDPEVEYIACHDGTLRSADGYLIDEHNNLYVYVVDYDYVVPVNDARVVAMGRTATVYDDADAELFEIDDCARTPELNWA